MSKLKLMTIIGTRPEIIRLAAVIKRCDRYFDQILVHTGQNYDYTLNQVFFDDLGLRAPNYYLDAVGKDLGETIGNIIAKSYQLMVEVKPDAVLVLGDTNSCLSVIGAKRLHIPIFHMEAGNRCFDECLPEETNRRIVDVTADVNMCYSEHARRYLNAAGTPRERTYVVGSPMAEVLHDNLEQIKASDILKRLGLEKGKYILLSAHREENIDTEANFFNLMNAVNAMAEKYDMPILYSCHPRSKKFIEQRGFRFDPRVIQHRQSYSGCMYPYQYGTSGSIGQRQLHSGRYHDRTGVAGGGCGSRDESGRCSGTPRSQLRGRECLGEGRQADPELYGCCEQDGLEKILIENRGCP